jgi:Brp/Blh family beta-carotene 15,15'-monooxygenase
MAESLGSLLLPLLLMLLLGVPHGAYDGPLLWRFSPSPGQRAAWLTAYLLLALAAFAFWRLQAEVAFGLFLLLSLIHFGRSDAPAAALPHAALLVVGFGGVFTLLLPWWHRAAVEDVLELLQVPHERFFWALARLLLPLWLLAAAWTLAVLLYHGRQRELLTFAGLVTLVLLLPPLWALCIYFCGLHARRHTRLVLTLLQDSTVVRRQMLSIMAVTLLLALWALWWIAVEAAVTAALVQTFFAGLFALTLPHMLLTDWLLPRLLGSGRYARAEGGASPHEH